MVREDVAKLVPTVDIAVPYFHWGWEGHYVVRDYQRELAHLCIDLGCKAVLGAHPHRVQGVEVYQGAPIFYSLANFVYGGNKDPQDKLSMIARIDFNKMDDGTLQTHADVVPIQITRWPEAPFQPFVLEGADRDNAIARLSELSAEFPATIPTLTVKPQEAAR
jgi:poly-gamma-glutamate synthesis protein (capsule biosynthesis protein)